ncbi:chitin deacetylase [Phlyctochytrium planicorne]|nr:chitin deacetylase [Phlyctochytrium planicorne]
MVVLMNALSASIILSLASSAIAQYPASDRVPSSNSEWNSKYLSNIPSYGTQVWTECRQADDWAITYDDGPGDATPTLLDTLSRANVKATFFVVGSRLLDGGAKETLKRAYAEGHQIGIHTWSHPHLTQLSNEQIVAEVMWTGKIIEDVIGVFPKYMRPPYGEVDERVLRVLKSMDLEVVTWNVDTVDYANPAGASNEIRKGISQFKGKSGVISLQHDIESNVVNQELDTSSIILKSGYNARTVEYCINGPAAYFNGQRSNQGGKGGEQDGNDNNNNLNNDKTTTTVIPPVTTTTTTTVAPQITTTTTIVSPPPVITLSTTVATDVPVDTASASISTTLSTGTTTSLPTPLASSSSTSASTTSGSSRFAASYILILVSAAAAAASLLLI